MNTLFTLAVATGESAPAMLKIIFWILVILSAVGGIGFRSNPNFAVGTSVVILILFAILGYYTFGF